MKTYMIKWLSIINDSKVNKSREFHDVQFKDFFVRATDDQNDGYTLIIPYTSIYDIEVLGETEL